MKAYELMLVLDPSLDEEAHAAAVEKITGIITADGGVVDSIRGLGASPPRFRDRRQDRR